MRSDLIITRDLKENSNYYVTSEGDVYSKHWHRGSYPKKLTPRITKKGYLTVHFYVDKKEITRPIHQLVAESFIPNPFKLPQVNHKDCNKRNNTEDNLEWCTNAENKAHAVKNGAIGNGVRHASHKFTEDEIRQVRSMFKEGVTYGKLAEIYNVDRKTTYDIVYHNTWKHII
jgi:hypothetical protein